MESYVEQFKQQVMMKLAGHDTQSLQETAEQLASQSTADATMIWQAYEQVKNELVG
ncbi:hypothetical protein AAF454_09315 [Kurthia gibsonii]|uniref:Uncharacterized protein n=1 Tax=Kurthia gibsonii TaxID=33946 RepID=A0ABU9LPL7_9BACL